MLGVKSQKIAQKNKITLKKYFFCIYILVMPKYWGKQIFAHRRFPEVGQKQKTERKRRREKEEERLNDGENDGQATHGARKHAWRTQAAWGKISNTEQEAM